MSDLSNVFLDDVFSDQPVKTPLQRENDTVFELEFILDKLSSKGNKVLLSGETKSGEMIVIYMFNKENETNILLRSYIFSKGGHNSSTPVMNLQYKKKYEILDIADIYLEEMDANKGYGTLFMKAMFLLVSKFNYPVKYITGWISPADWYHIERNKYFYEKHSFQVELDEVSKEITILWINPTLGGNIEHYNKLNYKPVAKIKKGYNFQKLTPINDADTRVYDDALNFVFDNNDIKNVAISGPYSAGKSSVIESYKNKNKDLKFIHISLAHFEGINESQSQKGDLLEGKILNQLIHQVDPSNIPQTNFKVKKAVTAKTILGIVVSSIVFLLCLLHIIYFDKWSNFVSSLVVNDIRNVFHFTQQRESILISGGVTTLILGLFSWRIVSGYKNKLLFRKLTFQGYDIEIFQDSNESYFDKYLNEVIYLFENSGADVIVFEDIDRYNLTQIFERLREINTLINNRHEQQTLRFFYLLRDDIFLSKDRTKFFDFIVPIVPVIDGSNSYDQFIKHFKDANIFELFDETFLQGIALYVDDMRILKNIYNEFIIYYGRIQSTELNNNKLLAIILYKNLFPKDFSDLQLSRGYVFTLFLTKNQFIENEIHKLKDKIIDLKNEKKSITEELLDDINDLDAIYFVANYESIEVNGREEIHFKNRSDFIKAIKDNSYSVTYLRRNYNGNYRQDVNIKDRFSELIKDDEYASRYEQIEKKNNKRISEIEAQIDIVEKEINLIKNCKLERIINKNNINEFFSIDFINGIGQKNQFSEIKESDYFNLIKYLIRNGFIDENYSDFMTYFYENSISKVDKIFLRSIFDEKPKPYDYQLNNPQLVLSRLKLIHFDQEEVMNFSLLEYILANKAGHGAYLVRFVEQIKFTKKFEFINSYLDTGHNNDIFVNALNRSWTSIFEEMNDDKNINDSQIKRYILLTFYYSSQVVLKSLKTVALKKFISQDADFLNIETPDISKIIQGIKLLQFQFEEINYETANMELFNQVYQNHLYTLNFKLICLILKEVYGFSSDEEIKSKNYTLITSKPNEPLAQYVQNNINEYLSVIFDECEEEIKDNELAALAILNNPEVETDYKEKYINLLQTKLSRIRDIEEKELWEQIMYNKLVKYFPENILDYYFDEGRELDSTLIRFINSQDIDLNFQFENKEGRSRFFNSVVKCNELKNKKYSEILKNLNMYYSSFSSNDISSNKIEILINLKIIRMSRDILNFIQENYAEHLQKFIEVNILKYTDLIISEESIEIDELFSLLNFEVDDKYKIKLLELTTEPLKIESKKYSARLKAHILNNNFHIDDLPFLLKTYYGETHSIKGIIEKYSIENINLILNEEYFIPELLYSQLVKSNEITIEQKIELFVLTLPELSLKSCKEYLKILGLTDYLNLFEFKRPKFKVNNINNRILSIFDKNHWISSFSLDKEDSNYYRAYGKKL